MYISSINRSIFFGGFEKIYRAEGAFRPTTVTVGGAFEIRVTAIRYALWARIKKTHRNRSS